MNETASPQKQDIHRLERLLQQILAELKSLNLKQRPIDAVSRYKV